MANTYTAEVIADSLSEHGARITTLKCRYPLFIHAEFLTHRMFSRNSASSRAIPTTSLLYDVEANPVVPEVQFKNCVGMQGKEVLDEVIQDIITTEIAKHVSRTLKLVKGLQDYGLHKQSANRYLAPFQHIDTLLTATDWTNFLSLRLAPDAQPEMQMLARAIREALDTSTPVRLKQGEWHLPFAKDLPPMELPRLKDICVGRCARVTYGTGTGHYTPEQDASLAKRLASAGHASPFEHIARPFTGGEWHLARDIQTMSRHSPHGLWLNNPMYSRNLFGWVSYRREMGL
jgi:thymidylate synthase ThyX